MIEIKHDGFRIDRKSGGQVRLYSRPSNDFTRRFPLIAEALARLRPRSCIIDGEAVACDDNGVASFDLIRNHRANDSVFLSKKCRPLSKKMQVKPPFSFDQMGAWWWPSGASKREEGNYENLRPMPWKAGIGYPLP